MTEPCPCCGQPLPDVPRAEMLADARMRPMERKLLTALLDVYPRPLTMDRAIDTLYGNDPNGGPEAPDRIVHVLKTRLRKVLAPYGWTLPSSYKDAKMIRLQRLAS